MILAPLFSCFATLEDFIIEFSRQIKITRYAARVEDKYPRLKQDSIVAIAAGITPEKFNDPVHKIIIAR